MTDLARAAAEAPVDPAPAARLVDSDVHAAPTPQMLDAHLSERSRHYVDRYGRRAPSELGIYPRARGGGTRLDAWPDKPGHRPGSDPEMLRAQLLDEWHVDYAILNVMASMDCYDQPAIAADFARAVNDWLVDEWLDFDGRLRASMVVAHDYTDLAVAEIERRADDPRFVSVFMPSSAQEALGAERYWPIYEAASARGLPIVFHTGGHTDHRGAGMPSYYLAYHVNISCVMQSQLISMVTRGMFDALPDLRIVLTECGVSWAASVRWALDAAWRLMGEDHPRLVRSPAESLRDQVWFTTQPIEEPDDPAHLLHAIEDGRLAGRLLFATDYPHWDFDSPAQALPRALGPDLRAAILHGNATELFALSSGAG